MFSIVIPTMWKCPQFINFLPKLIDHTLVTEVIIIDNDPHQNPQHSVLLNKKIKIISLGKNIYVNPAWNLGVNQSVSEYICILNDDIQFDTNLFHKLQSFIIKTDPQFGSIGFSPGVEHLGQKTHESTDINIIELQTKQDLLGYGTLMIVRKSNWLDIPNELKIYCGDAFIFERSIWAGLKNYLITDISHTIQYATTTNSLTNDGRTIGHGFLEKESVIYNKIRKNNRLYIENHRLSTDLNDILDGQYYDTLHFGGPISLGDCFVMNAIVHEYAKKCRKLIYPCKPEYYQTLKSLYKEHDKIQVIAFDNPQQEIEHIRYTNAIRIHGDPLFSAHIDRKNNDPENIHVLWPHQIYESFNLPYSKRYLNFKMPYHVEGAKELFEKFTNGEPYAVVHRYTDNHPQGIPINIPSYRASIGLSPIKLIEIEPNQTENMLQYKLLLENAQEIHCVPSSVFCLVDGMDLPSTCTTFFHDIRKNSLMKVNSIWNHNKWHIVNYMVRV
jgi:hypothetical protein